MNSQIWDKPPLPKSFEKVRSSADQLQIMDQEPDRHFSENAIAPLQPQKVLEIPIAGTAAFPFQEPDRQKIQTPYKFSEFSVTTRIEDPKLDPNFLSRSSLNQSRLSRSETEPNTKEIPEKISSDQKCEGDTFTSNLKENDHNIRPNMENKSTTKEMQPIVVSVVPLKKLYVRHLKRPRGILLLINSLVSLINVLIILHYMQAPVSHQYFNFYGLAATSEDMYFLLQAFGSFFGSAMMCLVCIISKPSAIFLARSIFPLTFNSMSFLLCFSATLNIILESETFGKDPSTKKESLKFVVSIMGLLSTFFYLCAVLADALYLKKHK